MQGFMEGLSILAAVDEGTAAHFELRLQARRRVEQAGGRLSINGVPPLPAHELSHLCSNSWQELRRLAPSLARRYDGSDGPPLPKRQRPLDDISGPVSTAARDSGSCSLVATEWLEHSLRTGVQADERDFDLPITAAPASPNNLVRHVLLQPGTDQLFRNAWYIYECLGPSVPMPTFDELWDERPDAPDKIDVSWGRGARRRWIDLPRLTQAYYVDYAYSTVQVRPAIKATRVPRCIEALRQYLNQLLGVEFNGVLVNWYRNNEDNISAHSDAEDSLLPGAPIASITLGDGRTFRLTDASSPRDNLRTGKMLAKEVARFELGDRCLFVMGGAEFQKLLRHEVLPAQGPQLLPGRYNNRRINLTFRCHVL